MTTAAAVAPPRTDTVKSLRLYESHIGAWEETQDFRNTDAQGQAVLSRLRTRGFRMLKDRTYRSLSQWLGRRGDLEVALDVTGRVVKIEFFQNLNVENANGGRYDFKKFQRMPRSMQLACVVEMTGLVQMLMERGYAFDPRYALNPREPLSREIWRIARDEERDPLTEFNFQWERNRFTRGPDGWPVPSECDSYRRNTMPAGTVKYFRHRGRLMRAPVYPTMNDGWTAYLGGERWWGQASKLFDCERPDLEPRRVFKDQDKRLERELAKETKVKNWRRVRALAEALERMAP